MLMNRNYDLEGDVYYTMNMYEFNKMLMRDNNIMFYLNLKAFLIHHKKSLIYLMPQLSEDVISRIFYESLCGINIQEKILEEIIIPALVWCIRENRLNLITPYFRLFDHLDMGISAINETARYLAMTITKIIVDEIKVEYYNLTDGMTPFMTYENSDDVRDILLSKIEKEISKYQSPNVQLFLSSSYSNINIYNIIMNNLKEVLASQTTDALHQMGFELDDSYYIKNCLNAMISL